MRIAYYTAGGREFASSRLRAWMIGDALQEMGHEVTFNHAPRDLADVYVFQKRFDLVPLMTQLRAWGKRVIWDCDDHIPGGPVDHADVVTVDTPAKLALYPEAVVIPDALDISAAAVIRGSHQRELRRVVWFGNADNYYHAAHVAEACRSLGLWFVAITETERLSDAELANANEVHSWDLLTVDSLITGCDVAACAYIPDGRWSAQWVSSKSANRLLKAWGLRMPVIGTPIPSYEEAGLQWRATTIEEWITALEAMRDPTERARDAGRGFAIAQQYRADVLAARWLGVFELCMQHH